MTPSPLSADELLRLTLDLEANEQRGRWQEPAGAPPDDLDPTWTNRVLHVSRSAVMITDAELDLPGPRIRYVNPAFEQLTGYSAAEALGRDPRFLQGPATDRRVLRRLREDLEATGSFEGQAVNHRRDGSPFVMSWRISTVRDTQGRPSAYVAVQEDATHSWLEELRSAEAILAIQRSSLPPSLPELGGLEVAVAYRPADHRGGIGGDWYDVIAAEHDHLVVGDVSGHGVAAAAEMGRLRLALHALVRSGRAPTLAVADLRRTLGASSDTFASLAVATVDDAREHLSVITCGHPAVAVAHAGGEVELVSSGHRMLGVDDDPTARAATVPVGPGDVVVMVTDGLLERRGGTVLDGTRRLHRWLATHRLDLDVDVLIKSLIADMIDSDAAARSATSDDITVVLARVGRSG